MKKRLTLEDTLNEEEDRERMRSAEKAAETLCKSFDNEDFYTSHDIDWEAREQKWTEFEKKNDNKEDRKAEISIHDVPWLPSPDFANILEHMAAFDVRRHDDDRDEEKNKQVERITRKTFRRANLRWHPDLVPNLASDSKSATKKRS